MKKCLNCQLVFYSDSRLHCLCCDSPLEEATIEEIALSRVEAPSEKKAFKAEEPMDFGRIQYIASSYFKTKSFLFLYFLARQELKIGKRFKRPLIYPIDFTFLVRIPWLIIDLIDSSIFHLTYKGFCEECQWKYKSITQRGLHNYLECDYNKEYSAILNAIVSGEIANNEVRFKEEALEKVGQGKRSAYHDLCLRKKGIETFVDVLAILISFGLIICLLARLVMPIFGSIYDF